MTSLSISNTQRNWMMPRPSSFSSSQLPQAAIRLSQKGRDDSEVTIQHINEKKKKRIEYLENNHTCSWGFRQGGKHQMSGWIDGVLWQGCLRCFFRILLRQREKDVLNWVSETCVLLGVQVCFQGKAKGWMGVYRFTKPISGVNKDISYTVYYPFSEALTKSVTTQYPLLILPLL